MIVIPKPTGKGKKKILKIYTHLGGGAFTSNALECIANAIKLKRLLLKFCNTLNSLLVVSIKYESENFIACLPWLLLGKFALLDLIELV